MKKVISFILLIITFIPAVAKTIVIEPGHGGKDTGVVIGNFVEKEYTKEFAYFLKKKIEESTNFKVIVIKKGKKGIYSIDKVRCFTYLRDADVFISIHVGADIESKSTRGIYIYVPPWKNEKISMEFAKKLKRHLKGLNKITIQKAKFKVLKHSSIPSIMIEVGYITNEKDRELLNDYNYRKKIADAIIKALSEWDNSSQGVNQ